MPNFLVELQGQARGTFTYNLRQNAQIDLVPKRNSEIGGTGYIAGLLPGVLTVDGVPAARPIELRKREGNRALIAREWSNPINGTYRFDDINPHIQFDLIARDEPFFVYNDIIVGKLWPWTDYEIIAHGLALPTEFGDSFSRNIELTGGQIPYSIDGSSIIPAGMTVNLVGKTLEIAAASDPFQSLSLTINDSGSLSKSFYIFSPLGAFVSP